MEKKTFIPNQNRQVLRMLAREFGKWNRGRNRILMSAVTLCIVTLTMVFGIASGKTKAEYIKAVRAAGTTASVRIADLPSAGNYRIPEEQEGSCRKAN